MSEQEALDVCVDALDVATETAKLSTDILHSTAAKQSSGTGKAVVLGLLALGAGCAAGYFVARKKLEAEYEERLKTEVAETKKFYSVLNKKDDLATPEMAVKKLHRDESELDEAVEAIREYQGDEPENDPADIVVKQEVKHNVFADISMPVEFDYDTEVPKRTPDKPYIISEDEYMNCEMHFPQMSITYFEGDGALADENDQEIPDIDSVIGEENLRFGYGSRSESVVFIRNERLSTEFEVLRHEGKYSHEILGFMHSDGNERDQRRANQPRKFRGDSS